MKKLIASTLGVVMMLNMVACGAADNSKEGVDAIADVSSIADQIFSGEIEANAIIRVLENDTAVETGYLDELISAFNEKYQEQGIVAVDANMDEYLNLEQDGPYGYGPDVLYQANDVIMSYVEGKHIYPLPVEKLGTYSQVPKIAWEVYESEVNGTPVVMGVPVNIQGPLFYYRKDLLPEDWKTSWDDNGNDIPDMIENWNDLYKYSKEVVTNSNGEKYGYMTSLLVPYYSTGFLYSYGAYTFGNNDRDTKDIGLHTGEAYKGVNIIRQLATIMNEECIDYSLSDGVYAGIGKGEYFATMITPDVYPLFIKELAASYEEEGLTEDLALIKAKENLVQVDIPLLPASGDLTEEEPDLVPAKMMGGVNGYAISAYTKVPNAALEFVDFATSYEVIMKRTEMLRVVPAREDVSVEVGELAEIINQNLQNGNITVMPSVRAVAQIWNPLETFFADLAGDPYRNEAEQKYRSQEEMTEGLTKVSENIYNAINTLE